MGTIFHDDRGLHEGPKWDKPEEKMMYKSLEWSIWFGGQGRIYRIRIFNKRGRIVYEGPLTRDKIKIGKEKYRYNFLPKELTTKQWLSYCEKEYKVELYTNEITEALKKEYNIKFDIGEVVRDDLTSEGDVVILNITLGEKNKTVGYWVNSQYLMGGRHPWEISKVDWKKRYEEDMKKNEQARKKDENSND
jgi:hypothetical protein